MASIHGIGAYYVAAFCLNETIRFSIGKHTKRDRDNVQLNQPCREIKPWICLWV